MVFVGRYRSGMVLARGKEFMKYDIQKYLDQARTFYSAISSFWNWGGYWKAGNIFDTMTDYLKVSGDDPHEIARIAYYFYQTLPGACWYDDYAWWGIAGSKAFDPTYDHIFEGSKSDFQDVTKLTWRSMKEAPNVWASCNQADFNQYSDDPTKSRWAVPRIAGGVWQYDMFKDTRYPAPTLLPEFSPANPSDPCSKDPYPPLLGPFQNTVVNTLYLLLAGTLQALKVAADPDPHDAVEREFNFLHTWLGSGLLWDLDGGAYLVRERVPTYDQPSPPPTPPAPPWPPVRAYYDGTAWCGDQGLLMAGLEVYYNKLHQDPQSACWWTQWLIRGVQNQLTKDGVVQYLIAPEDFKNLVGDFDDYMCGPGVFMRNLLRVFNSNPIGKDQSLQDWVINDVVKKDPGSNFIYLSAEDACKPTKYYAPAQVLFDLFNRLATLTTAYVILGAANRT
jgi:hypothetical protein